MWKILKQWPKKIFSDVHNAIVSLIVVALLATLGGAAVSKNLKLFLFEMLQTPTPLWSTILLVFLSCFLVYVRIGKNLSSSSLDFTIKYFNVGNQKWKTKILKSGYFEVDYNPICIKHDLPFVSGNSFLACPEFVNKKCDNYIFHKDHHITYKVAESYIDKKIRNKEY